MQAHLEEGAGVLQKNTGASWFGHKVRTCRGLLHHVFRVVPGSWNKKLRIEMGRFAGEREKVPWVKIKLHGSVSAAILIFVQHSAFAVS